MTRTASVVGQLAWMQRGVAWGLAALASAALAVTGCTANGACEGQSCDAASDQSGALSGGVLSDIHENNQEVPTTFIQILH
jgi:hypothetical protein